MVKPPSYQFRPQRRSNVGDQRSLRNGLPQAFQLDFRGLVGSSCGKRKRADYNGNPFEIRYFELVASFTSFEERYQAVVELRLRPARTPVVLRVNPSRKPSIETPSHAFRQKANRKGTEFKPGFPTNHEAPQWLLERTVSSELLGDGPCSPATYDRICFRFKHHQLVHRLVATSCNARMGLPIATLEPFKQRMYSPIPFDHFV